MTKFPGEIWRSRTNKQPLSYPTMNIKLTEIAKTAQALYNDSVPALARVNSHISHAKQKFHAFLKMDSIIVYNICGGYSPIRNKTPKYQELNMIQ